jgi:hypothetical protein
MMSIAAARLMIGHTGKPMLGAVLHRVDHAGDDERELDLVGDRLNVVVIVRYQISHRFGCVPVCAVAD